MALLKEDGSLDIERINALPYEEYMDEIGSLTESQYNEYRASVPLNESKELAQPVNVDYTLEEELARGAVLLEDYIKELEMGLDEDD